MLAAIEGLLQRVEMITSFAVPSDPSPLLFLGSQTNMVQSYIHAEQQSGARLDNALGVIDASLDQIETVLHPEEVGGEPTVEEVSEPEQQPEEIVPSLEMVPEDTELSP